jgi:hypothetical protein
MGTAAEFITAKKLQQSGYFSVGKWINQLYEFKQWDIIQ